MPRWSRSNSPTRSTIDPDGDGLDAPSGRSRTACRSTSRTSSPRRCGWPAAARRSTIDKRIPHGGGLGGGSADAAAVLRWAGVDDLAAASRLGADVPFCLVGGRARVQGIGEIVDAAAAEALDLTLVIPPLACSTPRSTGRGTTWAARQPTGQRPAARRARGRAAARALARPHRARPPAPCRCWPAAARRGSCVGHHPELVDACPTPWWCSRRHQTADERPPTGVNGRRARGRGHGDRVSLFATLVTGTPEHLLVLLLAHALAALLDQRTHRSETLTATGAVEPGDATRSVQRLSSAHSPLIVRWWRCECPIRCTTA